jgi:hypothetical protein
MNIDWVQVVTVAGTLVCGGGLTQLVNFWLGRRKQDDEHALSSRAQIFAEYRTICDGFRGTLDNLKEQVEQLQQDHLDCIEEKVRANTELVLLKRAVQHLHSKYMTFLRQGADATAALEAATVVQEIEMLVTKANELTGESGVPTSISPAGPAAGALPQGD